MALPERPREKALSYGVDTLSNNELLAVLLRCGYAGCSALQLADILIQQADGIAGLRQMSVSTMTKIKGISDTKAITIKCAIELACRMNFAALKDRPVCNDSKQIAAYLRERIGVKPQEHFIVLFLDMKFKLIGEKVLFIGSLNKSVVSCREIFKEAIEHQCAQIIISHNHPSDVCIPSEDDLYVTRQIDDVADMMDMRLVDHIIVGPTTYYSFKEHELL